ncbi:MAG: hypothetical protein N2C14_23700 [Planctomycetales bacterium]
MRFTITVRDGSLKYKDRPWRVFPGGGEPNEKKLDQIPGGLIGYR